MIEGGLVLEGGGMRGVYTAGVLDYLMDEGIWIDNVYGVSAGACHGTSYVARQRGRAIRTVMEYVGDRRYASYRNLFTTGNYFGEKFVYDDIPKKLVPFDYDAYAHSDMRLYSVVFNCRTGQAEYPQGVDMYKDMPYILASSSLPLLSKMVWIDGQPFLDGGIGDSIPIAKSVADGNKRNLIILTQHRGYRKQPTRMLPLLSTRYRRYPRMVEALRSRHTRYNEQLDFVYAQEEQGDAVIIQPSTPVTIRSMERDTKALGALYEQGYADARAARPALDRLFPQAQAGNA